MATSRKLGLIDTYVKFLYEQANGTTGGCNAVQIVGPLDAERVEKALDLIQRRQPLLRAFLSKADDGADCIVVDDTP